jgi:hypothetical protein
MFGSAYCRQIYLTGKMKDMGTGLSRINLSLSDTRAPWLRKKVYEEMRLKPLVFLRFSNPLSKLNSNGCRQVYANNISPLKGFGLFFFVFVLEIFHP